MSSSSSSLSAISDDDNKNEDSFPSFSSVPPSISDADNNEETCSNNTSMSDHYDHNQNDQAIIPDLEEQLGDMNIVQQQKNEICKAFARFRFTEAAQREMLRIMRHIKPETQQDLPIQGRTLRPGRLPYTLVEINPGELLYFGIINILSCSVTKFFDPTNPVIKLTLNIDGVPLFKSSSYNFWPILGSVENHEVFIIAVYGGPKKPICSNEYLRLLIEEISVIQRRGAVINGKPYTLVLDKVLMDAPAAAYVLGVKNHSGYFCCRKCKTKGKSVVLRGRISKNGRECRTICFPDFDDEPRTSAEFKDHYDLSPSDPHNENIKHFFENLEDDEDQLLEDDDLEEAANLEQEAVEAHHLHPCCLSIIKNFDLVKNIPLDYMHLICEGVMKRLLNEWIKNKYIISSQNANGISKQLCAAATYCPTEFQRQLESLDKIKLWKATQYRQFLLYIGVYVLQGKMETAHLRNFQRLVIAVRYVTQTVPKNDTRSEVLSNRAQLVRPVFRMFVEECIQLLGEEFVSYNVHNLLHVADDYQKFGSIDEYSCFRYESFLRVVTSLVTSGNRPLAQLLNKYSSLLKTGHVFSEFGDTTSGYYNEPELINPTSFEAENEENISQIFTEVRMKTFKLRSDNQKDCHCYLNDHNNSVCYVRIMQIKRTVETEEIFVIGKTYRCVRDVFNHPANSSQIGLVMVSNLSSALSSFCLEQIRGKCYAFPCNDDDEWAMAQYLH